MNVYADCAVCAPKIGFIVFMAPFAVLWFKL